MKVKDLEEVYDGTIWLHVKPYVIKSSSTNKYDEYEIKEITIDGDDDSLDVWLKEN